MGTLKLKKPSNRVLKPRKGESSGSEASPPPASDSRTAAEALPPADAPAPREDEGRTLDLFEFRAALKSAGLVLRAPYMVRVDKAIREATGLPWTQIERNLARLTNRRAYHKALIEADVRYDLAGRPSGPVDPEHKARARELLAKSRKAGHSRR
jgi:hypothetical protein